MEKFKPDVTNDSLLGGRLRLRQLGHGHRAGTDALLLASLTPPETSGLILDIGAGSGAVGLVAAMLAPQARVGLVEIDTASCALARANIQANALESRISVFQADVLLAAQRRAAGLVDEHAALVLTNPPFYDAGAVRVSPDASKARAHVEAAPLANWLRASLALLANEPEYRAYARKRGRVAIQTGFSDAGRFVGQIPAALAIERLQGRMAHKMEEYGLTDVAALIFNTHGESMGRGGHPSGMDDRLTWPMSVWARQQFAQAGIRTELEASFQGGDGYLFFRRPELALATLTRIAAHELQPLPDEPDPFYQRTDISLDFYRGIRNAQRGYMGSRTYARSVTAFGLGLLNETGSRKSRRQSDLAADRDMSLRQIRAIPVRIAAASSSACCARPIGSAASSRRRPMASCSIPRSGRAGPIAARSGTLRGPAWRWPTSSPPTTATAAFAL